jgi:alkanesulfonate monooxygenase SsuD/methylene tetrahydromethanopterin reductase-like flavin-dependent oxidoreductase (luciferase family)
MNVAVARQLYVASDRADAEAALARLAESTRRTVDVSRSPGRPGGSHVLAYADKTGATEEHALFGTPAEIRSKLEALSNAGAEYVLLTVSGGKEQLHRFADEIMPAFAAM